jgi:hypothetical protein
MDLDVVADTRQAPSRRVLAMLVGLTAVAAALFATLESDSGRREEQAFVRSSRSSVQIFAELAGGAPRTQFLANGIRGGLETEIGSTGRLLVTARASGVPADVASALSEAESATARRYGAAVRAMARVSPDAPLDPFTRALVTSTIPRVRRILAYQNRQVEMADTYGTRQERAMFAIALVAIAAVLLGLAGLMGGRTGRISMVVAAVALGVALVWGGSGLLA